MNVPKGFKQTEIGIIPQDWEVDEIHNLCAITTGDKNTQDRIAGGAYPFFVRSQIIERINSYSFDGEAVLTAGDGVGTGKIFHYINGRFDFHQRVYKMSNFSSKLSGYYFFQYFSNYFYNRIAQMTAKSSVDSVRKEMIGKMLIPLPPPAEQRAIAAVLSDTDALIEGMEKLLEKKRWIKQGAMQELLTGKRRISGFESKKGFQQTEIGAIPQDWGINSLMEHISALDAGVSVNSVDEKLSILGHSESVLKTSCVYNGYFLPEECKKILPKDISRAKLTPNKNSVIISRMNTPALVGECGYIAKDYPLLFLPDRLWQISFKNDANINSRWLAYILSFGEIRKAIKEIATGTSDSMKNIAKNALLKIKIPYPTKSEQTAIAAILSDMDSEIEQLENQLAKYRKLKTGMMQELLTGKKRLL